MSGVGEIAKLLTTDPPDLGPGPRRDVQPAASLNRTLDDWFARAGLPDQKQQLIRALVLLWHDHLDASHTIAQNIETTDGALLHGIMHRREPDYGNAKYWFHRVGQHPIFPELVLRADALLDAKGDRELREKLVPNGGWNAFAFIDACEHRSRRPASDPQKQLLREIQAAESRALLDWFCNESH